MPSKPNASKLSNPIGELMTPKFGFTLNMIAPIISANISLLHWNAQNCERMAKGYQQWLNFVGHRLEADASFTEQMQKIKDPKEMADACSVFVENATKDYQQEISELTKLSSSLANGAVDVLQDVSISPDAGAVLGE